MQEEKTFRDNVATVDQQGKRVWVFPQKPKGRYYLGRTYLSILYLAVFFGLPFLKVNGHPVFLINILERKFILFGQIFWPQDFFIFGLGMIIFIVFIALFTVVFGRFFCGWACPQTIFMEIVFRKIEYWIDGDAAKQKILSKASWNTEKILKRSSKWIIFWVVSFIIANTFLAYIIGIEELQHIITEPIEKHTGGLASLAIFTSIFFLVYAWFREQVCTVVCPYGRMQGVLLDKNSINVTYDHQRGEPRGKFNKKNERHIGDCIDCVQCVKVCPTGIDIRNGVQLECINCTACIDACDHMMRAVGFEEGLIRYASENNISTHSPFRFTKRMKAYTTVMVVLLGCLAYLLASRQDVGISLLRTPGQLYQQSQGHISNLYNYRLLNKTYAPKTLELRPENFKGDIQLVGETKLLVQKEDAIAGSLFITMDEASVTKRKTLLQIGIYEQGKKIQTITTAFLGPFKAN